MAPSAMAPQASSGPVGPSSTVKVSTQYYFQQEINIKLIASGSDAQREDLYRLQGVQLLHEARLALRLPAQTYACAAIYYHRFRLDHKDSQYQWQDAAMAALFTAGKIEDTIKKSKEIICAVHNLKNADRLSPDDPRFDKLAQTIVGLERLMLESSKFDFRTRAPPHKHVVKVAKNAGIGQDVASVALSILNDSYKTWAPMKQTTITLVFACLELACRLLNKDLNKIFGPKGLDYDKFFTKRSNIMETLLDLTDLYTHFHKHTIVGFGIDINVFIQLRITLNKEIDEKGFDRFCHSIDPALAQAKCTPKTPITPASPAEARQNGNTNGSNSTLSPRSSSSRGAVIRPDATIRFMLDRNQARDEQAIVDTFHNVEFEEYEIEIDEPIPPQRPAERHPTGPSGYRGRGDYGGFHRRGGRR